MTAYFSNLTVQFLVGVLLLTSSAAPLHAEPRTGVLALTTGDTVEGQLHESPDQSHIRWQGSEFILPFEFPVSRISSIKFPLDSTREAMQAEFGVELSGGDLYSGRLLNWDADQLVLESKRFGPLTIKAPAVRRLYRLKDNPALVFPALNGLDKWKPVSGQWREDGAQVWTDSESAMLVGDLEIPDRAVIELEISWTTTPSFVLSLGVDPLATAADRRHGWRLETWKGALGLVREQPNSADVAVAESITDATKRLHLIAYLDQISGQLSVYRPDGSLSGQIIVPPEKNGAPDQPAKAAAENTQTAAGRGIRLLNYQGQLRLESLRVSRWSGVLPTKSDVDGVARVEFADGVSRSGKLVGLATDARSLLLQTADGQQAIPLDQVSSVLLPTSADDTSTAAATAVVALQDGGRLSGAITAAADGHVTVTCANVVEPLRVPVESVRTITFAPSTSTVVADAAAPAVEGREGRLEVGGRKLTGRLVSSSEVDSGAPLVWHPTESRTSSPLKLPAAGRVVYRDPPPAIIRRPGRGAANVPAPAQNFFDVFVAKVPQAQQPKKPVERVMSMHLRSGDVVPCTVKAISEEGVTITSDSIDARLIPHDKIKALELIARANPPSLKKAKRQRLLTLPRLQKNSPPTHLLHSRTGDFLRCRLISMTDEHVRIEVQLNEVEIPTERIAQIIWFHPDELEAAATTAADESTEITPAGLAAAAIPQADLVIPEAPAADAAASAVDNMVPDMEHSVEALDAAGDSRELLVQVLEPTGNRVTFVPSGVADGSIIGESDVVGTCRFELQGVDQLIFGREIRADVSKLTYHKWKLRHAIEPLVAQDLPAGMPDQGTASPLVGQPAPDFQLELLSGENFRLSQCQGQVVVLDFWATWCGPCMETMPLLKEAMKEFDPAKVRLVSVNLEEPAEHIKGVLERHQLELTVALDIDGVAARRYEANAIPQLVVVDQQGKIARLYVGGGAGVVEELKNQLNGMLAQ